MKEIKKSIDKTTCEYDKRLKYLLSQTPYVIEEILLLQWYVTGLLRKN